MPTVFDRLEDLPHQQQNLVRRAAHTYNISFSRYWFFSAIELNQFRSEPPIETAGTGARSPEEALVAKPRAVLERIANMDGLTDDDRQVYLEALLNIYSVLPNSPMNSLRDPNVLFLGVEREGRILAEKLGWLPPGRSTRIHAKRMWAEGGLLVGLSDPAENIACEELAIVDGAIASGATVAAILDQMRPKRVRIYSVHAAVEGLRAIHHVARSLGIEATIVAGFVTQGLNPKYYAAYAAGKNGRKVVGDLGDIIWPLFDGRSQSPRERIEA